MGFIFRLFFFFALFVLTSFFIFIPNISAQEDLIKDESLDNSIRNQGNIEVELIQNTQDPKTKKIKFDLVIKPTITSDRVKVEWNVTGVSGLDPSYSNSFETKVVAGNIYIYSVEIVPTKAGITELIATIRINHKSQNIVSTKRKTFASNFEREAVPITKEYSDAKTIMYITDVIFLVFVVGLVGGAGYLGYKFFIKWYKQD